MVEAGMFETGTSVRFCQNVLTNCTWDRLHCWKLEILKYLGLFWRCDFSKDCFVPAALFQTAEKRKCRPIISEVCITTNASLELIRNTTFSSFFAKLHQGSMDSINTQQTILKRRCFLFRIGNPRNHFSTTPAASVSFNATWHRSPKFTLCIYTCIVKSWLPKVLIAYVMVKCVLHMPGSQGTHLWPSPQRYRDSGLSKDIDRLEEQILQYSICINAA